MKRYEFKLEAVLTLREQSEQTAQQAFARALGAVEAAAGRLRTSEAAISSLAHLRQERLAAGLPARELDQIRCHGLVLEELRKRLAQELESSRRQAEEARLRLVKATQQREALENLRERQRRAYEYETARTDQKLLDELSARGSTLSTAWREAQ